METKIKKRKGKIVVLTLDWENGEAFFKVSKASVTHVEVIIPGAAKIIWKYLFQEHQ